MSEETLARARAGDGQAFRELTDPYRLELQLHCYRILGSVQDAEDLLQETLLAAWRGLERFEGRSSLRAWLYRIATNRRLNALRDSGRQPQQVPAGAARRSGLSHHGDRGDARAILRGAPLRVVPTRANSQPEFGCYLPVPRAAIAHAYGLLVLTLEGDRISAITWFSDTGVFAHFGLARTLRT
jgi:Sigma-70 region 2